MALKHFRSERGRYVDMRPRSGAFVVDSVICDCMGCVTDDVVEDYHFGSAGSEMVEKSDNVAILRGNSFRKAEEAKPGLTHS